jgi:hypothetical protein
MCYNKKNFNSKIGRMINLMLLKLAVDRNASKPGMIGLWVRETEKCKLTIHIQYKSTFS